MKQTKTFQVETTIEVSGLESQDAAIITVELDSEAGGVTASGTAKRGNGDKYVPGVGNTLALARALESLARKLRREIKGYTS